MKLPLRVLYIRLQLYVTGTFYKFEGDFMMATVHQDMPIGEVLAMDNGTARIFMEFGMHCLGCPHATAETLAQACGVHGADANALVEKLNAFLAGKA